MEALGHKIKQKLQERCNREKDKDAKSEMTEIEALMAITAAVLVFLGVSGSFRRRSGNGAFAIVAFAAYTLMPALIAYTLGLIQTAPFCTLRLPVWATYLVVILGNVDSYTAHSMEDIERWKSFKIDAAVKYIMISWMIAKYSVIWSPIVSILFVVLFTKVNDRAQALMMASNSVMQKNYRFIADYMSTEHESNDGDPAAMRGYRYLVRVPEEATTAKCRRKAAPWLDGVAPQYRQLLEVTDEVITVDEVWNCEGWLLSVSGGDRDGRLKDLCLSFSLFKFVCLKFTGYSLPRQAHDKLWRLIQHMLSEENGHERVFRIIEVELAFLFDLFYTKHPLNLHRGRSKYRLFLLPIVVAIPLIFLLDSIWDHMVFTAVVTFLLLMSILVVELTQFGIMIFSEWAKVTYICKYVRNERWRRNICVGKLIKIMCRVQLVKPWGRQLRQYSFLKSYSYSPFLKCIYNGLTAAYLDKKRNGQEQIAPTNLSEQVKKAIARSLRREDSNYLEKGRASLRLNGWFDGLSWACNLETTTHVIMVWHIATTVCEHKKPPAVAQLSQEQRDNFGVATKLSQYLAYLVVFAPRLLPGHPCRTEYIFDCAVREARSLLGGSSVSMEKRILELETVSNKNEQSIVGRGARLGMQLVHELANEERIWKVLADFWADMMLYVAPSDDTAAHAKYLTTGGEFVTHVWVLVSQAGIPRDPRGGEEHDDPERN
ncbi:Glutathione transferase [Psidium guajava]|nr:Glutathione transferase [Psidium guajava]